jgi:hypothetical protein
MLKVREVEHQIRQWRVIGWCLPIQVRELNRANLLYVPASVPYGAPISPCAFDLVRRESFAALQSPQSGMNIGNPEQDP